MAFVYFSENFEKLYNCSFYVYESIPLEKRLHLSSGWLHLITFAGIWILYIPCIIGMCDKTLLKNSCYKLMLYLAILNLNTSIYVGLWAGYINVTGSHFCSSRKLLFWIGALNNAAWNFQSTATVLLAFNRCADAYDKRWGKFLFHGIKTYFWMVLPFMNGFRSLLTGPPGIYTPIYGSIMFNPHAGYALDVNKDYLGNNITNIFVSAAILLIYAIYIILHFGVVKKSTAIDIKQTTKVFGQVLLIAFSLFFVASGYLLMQLIQTPQFYKDFLAYCFLIFDGIPAIIYLTLNKTIRGNIQKRLFPWRHSSFSRVIEIPGVPRITQSRT